MKEYSPVKEGKVREIYDTEEGLIIVTTDRISAFDVILKNEIPGKGRILNQLSEFWFNYTRGTIRSHIISTNLNDMPPFFRAERFEGRSMLCRKLKMIPVECIVRGYITGSGWKSYQEDGTVCGIKLPEGLRECEQLPEPIYTPSTKAEIGDHDENISFEESVEFLSRAFPEKGESYAGMIRDASLKLYQTCAAYARTKGIIIADTKFEFGLDEDGALLLADEVLTPDSSRFWPLKGYEPGKSQPSFDKQYVRDWLKANPDNNGELPEDVIQVTAEKYAEAYRLLTDGT